MFTYETWLVNTPNVLSIFKTINFDCICVPAEKSATRGRAKGGIICLINKNIYKYKIINISQDYMFLRIKIKNLNIIIGAVYISPLKEIDIVLVKISEIICMLNDTFPNDLLMLGGDFNARVADKNQIFINEIFDGTNTFKVRVSRDRELNGRGKKLLNCMEEHGLILLNGRTESDYPANFTFLNKTGKSVIDLVWCNVQLLEFVKDLNVFQMVIASDHFPVVVSLMHQFVTNNNTSSKEIMLKWKNDHTNLYYLEMSFSKNIANLSSDINNLANNLTFTINNTSYKLGLVNKKTVLKNNKPWFDIECQINKKNVKNMLKKCKKASFSIEEDIADYDNAKCFYKKLIKFKKTNFTNNKLDLLSKTSNPTEFWKIINGFRRRNIIQDCIPLKTWTEFFKSALPTTSNIILDLPNHYIEVLDADISISEVENSLKKIKNNKAPGQDGISNEFFKWLPNNWTLYLVVLFNKILEQEKVPDSWAQINVHMLFKKGDRNCPENYRPIALMNSITKIFTQILNYRLSNWAILYEKIPEFQAGFRQARGCLDNIFSLNTLIQLQLQKNKGKAFALFIDFKSAFPSVKHNLLWKKLLELGVSSKFINIIRNLYSKAFLFIKNKEGLSEPIPVVEGVLQGDTLSPLLFSLFLSDLESFLINKGIRGVSVSLLKEILLLAYADDIVILSDSVAGMKRILKALSEYCKLNQLNVNIKKTKIVVFKKGGYQNNYNFYFESNEIEIVPKYVYLGITFSQSALFELTSKEICSKANIAVSSTISLLKSTKLNSWLKINKLFDSLVSSIIAFATPVWSPMYLDNIDRAQCLFFKKILKLPQCTPNYAIRLEVGRPHLAVLIFKLLLDWIIKLVRMNIERYPKICFLQLYQKSKKKNGNEKYNWVEIIKNTFFLPINEIELWDNLDIFLNPNIKTRLIDKYRKYSDNLSLSRYRLSTSLYIYPSLNITGETQTYLNSKIPFEMKNIFAQIRLLNRNCTRIVTNIRAFKLNKNTNCELCNIEDRSLFHFLFDCQIFNAERANILPHNEKEMYFSEFLINNLNDQNPIFINKFIKFSLLILDKDSSGFVQEANV